MVPWVSHRPGTWLIDECQIAFFHELSYVKGLDPTFLSLFSMSFVLPSIICLVSWIPRIPVLCSPDLKCQMNIQMENFLFNWKSLYFRNIDYGLLQEMYTLCQTINYRFKKYVDIFKCWFDHRRNFQLTFERWSMEIVW